MGIGDPPAGSCIRVRSELDGVKLEWRKPSGGVLRYVMAGFLVFWLCGWSAGLIAAGSKLLEGGGPTPFLAVWLALWVFGGGFAGCFLYLLLRRQAPESVTLGTRSLVYDTGTAAPGFMMNPFFTMRRRPTQNPFVLLFRRRKRYEFSRAQCPEFVLEGMGGDQRLRFDAGADRVEIGETLKEPEREWLAQVLQAWREA